MSNTLRTLISTLTLAILMTGCGESFQATFTGESKVGPAGCGAVANNPYDMELNVSISDSSTEMVITKMTSKLTNSSDESYRLASSAKILGTLEGNTSFSDVDQIFGNDDGARLNASATIAADRSEITAFSFTLTNLNGSNCTFQINAAKLIKKQ